MEPLLKEKTKHASWYKNGWRAGGGGVPFSEKAGVIK